jgi:phage tail-like protein
MPDKLDLYSSHRFAVELKGVTEALFTECSGLQIELEVQEWQEGGLNNVVHRLPGRVKTAPNLVLKRGLATDDLWKWFERTSRGTIQRYNLSIIVTGYDSMPEVRWDVEGALPIKWVGPSFKSDTGAIAFETIELMHQGFARVK